MQNINITPNASKLINSLRYLTYTNESAIADIVDNSFDAGADNVNIFIDKDRIIIVDDGCGMTPEIMNEAIKLGSDTEKEQGSLGKFGMGLVTASISIGRRLEVISRDLYADAASKVVLSLDHIEKTNSWEGITEPVEEEAEKMLERLGHGTVVKISQLDHLRNGAAAITATHLRTIFRGFLMGGKTITLNGELLTPIDPLNRDLDDTSILLDTDIEHSGEMVHIVVAHIDTQKSDNAGKKSDSNHIPLGIRTQGFYVVRNNREIAEAQTLGIYTRHPSDNRFRCEISYDGSLDEEFGINFTKKNIEMEQALKDKISAQVTPMINLIGRQGTRESQVKNAEKIDHKDAETIIKRKKAMLTTNTNWKEKRNKPTPKPKPEVKPEEENKEETEEEKKKRNRKNIRKVQPGSKAMPAEITEADLGQLGPMFDCYFEGNKIVIRWNIRHPFHTQLIARFSGEKNVLTPVDLLVYSLAQEMLTLDEESEQQAALQQAIVGMSTHLRTLMQ